MKKAGKIILILVIVLLIGGIIYGGYFLYKNNEESNKKIAELENKIATINNEDKSNSSNEVINDKKNNKIPLDFSCNNSFALCGYFHLYFQRLDRLYASRGRT